MSYKTSTALSSYSHLVIIQNMAASNSARAQKLAEALHSTQPWATHTVVDITGYNQAKTYELIQSAARGFTKKTLVGIGGGDGTVSSVVNVLATSQVVTEENQSAALFPLWGGNANDLSVMLNGLINTTSFKKVLSQGYPADVYPLLLTITPPNSEPIKRTAICYASFGASAHILERMEQSSHKRDHAGLRFGPVRLIAEGADVWRSVFGVSPVRMQAHRKKTATMYDRIFVNGSRFAKVLHSPVSLNDPSYYEMVIYSKGYRYVFETVRSLFSGRGRITDQTQRFLVKNVTMCQIDGEVIGLEAGTTVEIGLRERALVFFSRKLARAGGTNK